MRPRFTIPAACGALLVMCAGLHAQNPVAGAVRFMTAHAARDLMDAAEEMPADKYGYKPTQLRTSYDALAVYVSKDNPIEKLTLAQVDAVFSKTRRRGYKQNVTTWGQLGLTGLVAVLVFLVILAVGFLYAWQRGALEWD